MRKTPTRFVQGVWTLAFSALVGFLTVVVTGNPAVGVTAGAVLYVVLSYRQPAMIRLTDEAVVLRLGPFGVARYEVAPGDLRTDFDRTWFLNATVTLRTSDRRRLGLFREVTLGEHPMFPDSDFQRALAARYRDRLQKDSTDSFWKRTM